MDPILLTLIAVFYFVTKGKIAAKAYDNGKEPPGVARARMRHEGGGGGHSPAGRPKGKGAFRLMLASRWAGVCDAAAQRAEHQARRQQAWYEETAPQRDAAWREAQERKAERREAARRGWAKVVGLVDPVERARRAEEEAWAENQRRDRAAASTSAATTPEATEPASGTTSSGTSSATPDNSTTTTATTPATGCVWVWPRGETCGQDKQDGSPYCTQHSASARSTTCLWAQGNPDVPKCANQRPQHQPFCDEHQREFDARTNNPEQPPADHKPDTEPRPASYNERPCVWMMPSTHQMCGDKRDSDSLYCGKHRELSSSSNCLWGRTPGLDARCSKPRPQHQPFCDEHQREFDARTNSPEQTDPVADQLREEFDDGFAEAPPTTQADTPSDSDTAPTESAAPANPPGAADNPAASAQQQGSDSMHYREAVSQLIAAADQVAQFRANLAAFGDTLAGKKWGQEVVGPIADMDSRLAALEGNYRDLSGQMQHQGSQGEAAYDQAPYVPGPEAVLVS